MASMQITIEILLNSFMIAIVAAMVRVMFTKLTSFSDTAKIFFGSVLFGVIIGYISNDFDKIKPYIKIIVAVASLFGKELYLWLEKIVANPNENLSIIAKIFSFFKGLTININNGDSKKVKQDDVN